MTKTPWPTPSSMNGEGKFSGDLTPLGVTMDASGVVDAATTSSSSKRSSYVVALMEAGARSFPSSMGAVCRRRFMAEATFGIEWLRRCGSTRQDPDYQVGIGEGKPRRWATTMSGGCRRPMTPTAAPT